ncbi:hypothetical protein NCAS_0D04930 [Naumovozyma castellii]|uniref:allantoicase n=1 Tax=Naumovozyma castellii TaxID=27288 RepID=G0VET3_NAUCA|nr:hypothetical protein NCAS_0D04930 [Naumovozyma castellii CBS 4309]CCC70074.1 hypothetical protein NCAS_0D04930 [Naumovozyma castellii CBS 4309]
MEVTKYSDSEEKQFLDKIVSKYHAVDIIGEKLEGSIVSCSDEWFASAENLIKPLAPIRDTTRFTPSGAWYDGWETRRHNDNEYDWVIIQMGVASAQIIGAEINTAFFNGNHAPYISVQGIYKESKPDEDDPSWEDLIDKTECGPSQRHFLLRKDGLTKQKYNFVKLKMYPDGGIARFRLYGKVVLPQLEDNEQDNIDLAFVGNGGITWKYSDQHFGSADNLLLPGRGHDMSDGWETKRSRTPNHTDWVIIKLGKQTRYIDKIIIDTAHYKGNFPQYITIHGCKEDSQNENEWVQFVAKSKTGPDKEHVYTIRKDCSISYIKLTIIPDGGVKRIRVWGK